ncbi:MAG: ATP synthase F0 subunit B [Deltaproteobacteria bacterium]|jgi:F-type H+-transporting ATPase subunit b|nr:ATP synthase F0 subunit B [Deltaproteobacteria bacterium]
MRDKSARVFVFAVLALTLALFLSEAPAAASGSAEVAAEAAGAGGHASFTGYTSERWRDFGLRVMNFAAFVIILWFLLRKPVKSFFAGRRENIARTLEYLETQAANLEEQNLVLQKKLTQLSVERESVLAQYERDGARERDRIIAEAHAAAELLVKKTEIAMEQELKLAKRRLANETGRLAAKIAEDLLKANVTDEDKSRLMLDFVANVTKLPMRH